MNMSHSILGTYLNKKLRVVFLTFKFGRIAYTHTHTRTRTHNLAVLSGKAVFYYRFINNLYYVSLKLSLLYKNSWLRSKFVSVHKGMFPFMVALVVKNPPANAGNTRDTGLIPGLGRSPGGGHDNTL